MIFIKDSFRSHSPDIDWDEFESDYNARLFLETRINRLSNIIYRLESTKILHDSNNYEDSLRRFPPIRNTKSVPTKMATAVKAAELSTIQPTGTAGLKETKKSTKPE